LESFSIRFGTGFGVTDAIRPETIPSLPASAPQLQS
jgi:hypothetical protein